MLSRKIHDQKASNLESSLESKIKTLFNKNYELNLKNENLKIDFFSFLYPDEIVFIFSLLSTLSPNALPVSLFLSLESNKQEVENNSAPIEKLLIDEAGHFFDDYFNLSKEDKDDIYTENWQLVDPNNNDLYFKISRENVDLFLKAEKLLEDSEN